MNHGLICYKEKYSENLWLVIRSLVFLSLEESRAVTEITARQEEQGVEPGFCFGPIFNKNNLEISKHFKRLDIS